MVNCKHLKHPLRFIKNIYGDEIIQSGFARSVWKCDDCNKLIYRDYLFEQGNVSDGYHTFDELYNHRAILFSVICNDRPQIAWKSKLHHDGTMYKDMFIVGIETLQGQATYHYDIEPYWDIFNVKELSKAPAFDGHTPTDAINRIYTLNMEGNNA